ncbi:Uncharacterised protein [Bordetella pertussis]|nr:Uncharacterised protein [Bordetella pertussis]CFE03895.1 Uncharacterised protein [Bordetella pertussis]CFL77077.1 Uncharacterised protein [Bordetella pertussis]CFL85315.1 Uncharacterised protein [Bordetella pertussis]CFM01297.1 Uncharacterised protein [Bordetella pertussis]
MTRRTHLVTGWNSAMWSSSWKALRSVWSRLTSCTSAITGTETFMASASGATSRVAAGPFWAVTMAGLPLTRA